MPSTEVLVWILTGCVSLISVLGATVWKMVREEAKEQAEQLKKKADITRVKESEDRWANELRLVREGNETVINKLEARQEKEISMLSTRLSEQIKNTENNIMAQMRLMLEMLNKRDV